MPTIALFFGIVVQMYWRDHAPPHFHAYYNGFKGSISIDTGELIAGELPRTARRILRQWALEHQDELRKNWELGRLGEPFVAIQGADYDD